MTGHSTFKIIKDKYSTNKWLFLGKNIHSLKLGDLIVEEVINFIYIGERELANMLISPSICILQLEILTSKDTKTKTLITKNDIVRNLTLEEYQTLEKILKTNNFRYNKRKNEFTKTNIGNTINTK